MKTKSLTQKTDGFSHKAVNIEIKLARSAHDWRRVKKYLNDKHNELKEYKRRTGHCRVPLIYPSNIELGRWVSRVRSRWGAQSPARRRQLQAIGFIVKFGKAEKKLTPCPIHFPGAK